MYLFLLLVSIVYLFTLSVCHLLPLVISWFVLPSLQYREQGPEEESQNGGPHHEHGDWWKCHCHEESWARFPGPHRTLDAVTWVSL